MFWPLRIDNGGFFESNLRLRVMRMPITDTYGINLTVFT